MTRRPPLKLYTAIGRHPHPDDALTGCTRIICDSGAGKVRGVHVGVEWHADGGWHGPKEDVDEAALRRYFARVGVGSIYNSNGFEDKLDTKLAQVAAVLAAAHRRGCCVSWYGLPGLRWKEQGALEAWRAANDRYMAKLGPFLDWLTPSYYFNDDALAMEAWYAGMVAESLDEAARIAGGRPIAPVISPYTHDGRAVPIVKTLELVAMFRARGITRLIVWTDRGATPHVRATIAAIKKA